MGEKKLCRYCGRPLTEGVERCPSCGAMTEDAYVVGAGGTAAMAAAEQAAEAERAATEQAEAEVKPEETITHPRTIEELQRYCAQKGMPLVRMRFFIGENYKQPKAFGIYRDGKDVIVYKNKDTGVRAIRYQGPDEEFAVNEIFQKLLSECHMRGIYPDGEPAQRSASSASRGYRQKSDASTIGIAIAIIAFIAICGISVTVGNYRKHKNDGYYQDYSTGMTYYRYGDDWSLYDTYRNDWVDWTDPNIGTGEGYFGDSYGDLGVPSIETSSIWDDWHASDYDSGSSFDSSYDSWDSGGTDWGSDW